MTKSAINEESRKSMATLMVNGTLADNLTGDNVYAVDRTIYPLNTIWVKQRHATANATVIIEASPRDPEADDEFWVPIASITATTTLVAGCRVSVLNLPIGAWRMFRARVSAEDGVGAAADVFITSQTMSS